MKTLKNYLKRQRRHLYEFFGSDRYSDPGGQISQALKKHLLYRDGFFIEAGANDGFSQSNTYYYEKFLGWKGILIEPIPQLYKECIKNRSASNVFNCALVPFDDGRAEVTMIYADLMSLVKGSRKSDTTDLEHVKCGVEIQDIEDYYELSVPAKTLTSILDEVGVEEIDFFSLDVEGYELNVLKGLDLTRYRPRYMLIEVNFREEIEQYIATHYEVVEELSSRDVLYRRK